MSKQTSKVALASAIINLFSAVFNTASDELNSLVAPAFNLKENVVNNNKESTTATTQKPATPKGKGNSKNKSTSNKPQSKEPKQETESKPKAIKVGGYAKVLNAKGETTCCLKVTQLAYKPDNKTINMVSGYVLNPEDVHSYAYDGQNVQTITGKDYGKWLKAAKKSKKNPNGTLNYYKVCIAKAAEISKDYKAHFDNVKGLGLEDKAKVREVYLEIVGKLPQAKLDHKVAVEYGKTIGLDL